MIPEDKTFVHSSREMATLSAEGMSEMGLHLAQMSQIVSGSSTDEIIQKMQMEHARHEKYIRSFKDQHRRLEIQLQDEQEKMVAWKRQRGGGTGPSLIDELKILQRKVLELEEVMGKDRDMLDAERQFRVRLQHLQAKQQDKVVEMLKMWMSPGGEKLLPVIIALWKRFTDSEIKYRFKHVKVEGELLVERFRKMRKDGCNRVLKALRLGSTKRAVAMCFLGWQEELVENRFESLHEELTRRHENEMFIAQMQVAQATGDEEKAKELMEEQNRRMEEQERRRVEAERLRDEAREAEAYMGEQKRLAEHRTSVALGEKEGALEGKRNAELKAEDCEKETQKARRKTVMINEQMLKALDEKEEALVEKDVYKQKNRRLTMSLNELGAESDDDLPEEDKAKPWYIDEQGKKVPRPRTRKERMQMSFNETLTCRQEMRLQTLAILDTDLRQKHNIDRLTDLVKVREHSYWELKTSHQALQDDLESQTASCREKTAREAQRVQELEDKMKQKDHDLSEIRRVNQVLQDELDSERKLTGRIRAQPPEKLTDLVRPPDRSLSELGQASEELQGDSQAQTGLRHNQTSQEGPKRVSSSPRALAAAEFKEILLMANLKDTARFRPQSAAKLTGIPRQQRPKSAADLIGSKENRARPKSAADLSSTLAPVGKQRASSASSRPKPGTLIPFSADAKRVFHVAWR